MLWDHATKIQVTLSTEADVRGVPKSDKEGYAQRLVAKASPLLIANRLRTDTVRVSACYAPEPLLGSAWTPVAPRSPHPKFRQALCAWWNSTPGILTLLNARAKALDYTRFALQSLRSLLVRDPEEADIEPLAEAFAKCRNEELLPWPRLHECAVRGVLHQAAARVLRIDGLTVADWRERIARERTISGNPIRESTQRA